MYSELNCNVSGRLKNTVNVGLRRCKWDPKLACYFSCYAFFSVPVRYSYEDLEIIICVGLVPLAHRQSNQDCGFLCKGAVSTLLPRLH